MIPTSRAIGIEATQQSSYEQVVRQMANGHRFLVPVVGKEGLLFVHYLDGGGHDQGGDGRHPAALDVVCQLLGCLSNTD